MSNKFTGITSAGQNVPVYDKAAHSAIDSVSGYISAHEDSWTATNLPETISAKEVDLYGTSDAYKNKLTINGFEAHVAPDGVNAPSAIYAATNANLYNPTNDSWTVITPGSVRVQTSAEEYTLAPSGGLALRSKSTTDNIMVGVKGMSGRASNAASFSVGVKGLKINDGQQSIFCGAEGFDYTDFSNSMNVKITPQNGLQQTYRDGGSSKTVYLKNIGETVLYNGTIPSLNTAITLSESFKNFELLRIHVGMNNVVPQLLDTNTASNRLCICGNNCFNYAWIYWIRFDVTNNSRTLTHVNNNWIQLNGSNGALTTGVNDNDSVIKYAWPLKIYGINRK